MVTEYVDISYQDKEQVEVVGSVRDDSQAVLCKGNFATRLLLPTRMRDLEEDEKIERAIQFLVHSFESSGDNPKPVILHSTRVGIDLYHRGYETHIVISGFLHDLLEDTDVAADEIRSKFGDDVASVVEATSFDENIDDYLERHLDIYVRCFELGRSAVAVKAADILDNSDYYGLGDSEERQENQIEKMSYFIDESEPYIGDEDLHLELQDKFPVVRERVKNDV
ncbi:HD domain-containing protein [Halobacterium yunchengense]|uniref:HD domain-containing protein n=1 Tax=Halobacterium yunchengense TaxID=3108497 RepID=UPI0030091950